MAYDELQQRVDQVARHRENHGRYVSVSTTFTTTGSGILEFDERVDFGVTYIDRPRVHYGSEIDADDVRNVFGLTEADPLPLPACSGSVVAWDQDENENYVGAWCAVRVTLDLLIGDIVVIHHFDFTGIGLKVIPHDPTD